MAYVSLTDLDTATRVLARRRGGASAPRGKDKTGKNKRDAEDAEDELRALPHRGRGRRSWRAAVARR